jgi:hypothetical protein
VRITWRRTGNNSDLALRVPPNASVTLHLHAADPGRVTEAGHPLRAGDGLHLGPSTAGTVNLTVGAGRYSFRT